MNDRQFTVLLLGGARRVSLAEHFKLAGEKIGCKVNVVSYDLHNEIPISLVAKVVVGLKFTDPGVIEDIGNVIKTYSVDMILPIVNGSVQIAAECKERFPEVWVPVTDFAIAEQLFDKADAAKAFKEAGLPIPTTYSVLNAKVPAIVKPRKGGSSRGIMIFKNMEEMMRLQDYSNYIMQEFIGHRQEYTVDSYIDKDGNILVTVPRQRLEVMGGESTRSITCRNAELERLTKVVIEKFSLRGPVNVQFIHDLDTDRYLLMEVNPRIGGGVICSMFAGAPIADYILGEALGRKLEPCTDWKENTLMARYFKEAVFFNSESAK